MRRFLCSQTIAMSLQGIPGIYFNSLLGAGNDLVGVEADRPRPQHQPAQGGPGHGQWPVALSPAAPPPRQPSCRQLPDLLTR
jgi:hypothetical protein